MKVKSPSRYFTVKVREIEEIFSISPTIFKNYLTALSNVGVLKYRTEDYCFRIKVLEELEDHEPQENDK